MPYELVVVDNSTNKYSIFEAYNIGVKRSKGTILCFMHDDIFYHTDNWGVKLLEHFTDEDTGAIGIAGTPYATKMPGSWWGGNLVNLQQLSTHKDELILQTKQVSTPVSNRNQVILLDGVWFCIRKSLFNEIKFDEVIYSDFHFYDVDICMQVATQKAQIYCVYDILIEHTSSGNVNKAWIDNAIKFQQKWEKILPLKSANISYNQKCQAEYRTINEFLLILLANKIERKAAYKIVMDKIVRYYFKFFFYKSPYYLLKYINKAYS